MKISSVFLPSIFSGTYFNDVEPREAPSVLALHSFSRALMQNKCWCFKPDCGLFFLMFVIHRANKKGTSQNLLDEAMGDKNFYERVRKADGWSYEIDEKDAKKYKKKR